MRLQRRPASLQRLQRELKLEMLARLEAVVAEAAAAMRQVEAAEARTVQRVQLERPQGLWNRRALRQLVGWRGRSQCCSVVILIVLAAAELPTFGSRRPLALACMHGGPSGLQSRATAALAPQCRRAALSRRR